MSAHSAKPAIETVDALLAATVRIVEDKHSRGQTTDGRAAQLVGFVGVILAIDAAFGRDVLDHGISGAYADLFVAFFAASLSALVLGAFIAIRGVLLPQVTLAFMRRDLTSLADGDAMLAEPIEIKRTLIRTYGEDLVSEEQRNDRKLAVVNRAALLLMLGVLLLACGGVILAVEHFWR